MLILLHPLIDFCSVAVLVMGGFTYERWLVYGATAFALQLPLGVALDAWRAWERSGFCIGCLLTASAAIAAAFGYAGWLALGVACVGNALFHLTAGANVLARSPGKSGPVGLFISTGALGLTTGQIVAKNSDVAWAVVLVAVALMVGTMWQMMRRCRSVTIINSGLSGNHRDGMLDARCALFATWVIAGLFALVVWRSWAGLLSGRMSCGVGVAVACAGAFVTWAGKATGGFLADALMRINLVNRESCHGVLPRAIVTTVSVAGSALLCFVCSPSNVLLWLALLFVAQLATGPVLSMMYERCDWRAGTAFGLNCLGLFTGSLI